MDASLIARADEIHRTIGDALGGRPAMAEIALFIGPEGGYDEEEVRLAESWGVVPVSLGSRILRTETAAIVGAALVLHQLGELG